MMLPSVSRRVSKISVRLVNIVFSCDLEEKKYFINTICGRQLISDYKNQHSEFSLNRQLISYQAYQHNKFSQYSILYIQEREHARNVVHKLCTSKNSRYEK